MVLKVGWQLLLCCCDILEIKGLCRMNKKQTILVVDDEEHILELLRFNFETEGFNVLTATTGEEGIGLCSKNPPDIIILDIMLPGMDGLEVCRILKARDDTRFIPIIMLTAKGTELDKVIGLELGADDYVTKPFGIRELIARVRAHLRRMDLLDHPNNTIIEVGPIVMDISSYEVFKNGKKLELTLKEFQLLRMLIENMGRVLTRDTLLDNIWGYGYYGDTRTVDVHIRYLRKKLGEDLDCIETIRGVGYKFSLKGET